MFEIGIVIRTYNEAELLPRTLDSLMAQKEQSFEIILVDSGSTDATVQIARGFERVKIIEIPRKDFTYGRALNMGIAAAAERVKYIAMLSGHAIPCDETWLGELVAPMFRDPHVVGVYGKQIPLPEHIGNPIVRALAADAYPKCYGNEFIVTNRSSFFSAANCAIRYNSWRAVKFDETLPYSEDQLWSKAVVESGGWLAYQPTAVVYHSHSDTFKRFFGRQYHEENAAMPEMGPVHSGLESDVTKVVILLLDGFRWDYLNTADTPFLSQAKNQGVCVERLATTFGFTQSRAIFAGSNRLCSDSFGLFAFDPANSTFDFVRTDPRIKTFAKASHWWHSLYRLPFGRGLARRFEERFQKRSSRFRKEVVDQARRKIPYAFAGHIPFAVLNHLRINYTGAKVHEPGGLPYESIFDCLREASVKFAYLMHPEISCDDDRVVEEIINSICSKESQVIFAQLSEADAVVHTCGPSSNLRRKVVGEIERKIRFLADALPEDVVWVVFGDHGMTDIDNRINAPLLLSSVESRTGARLGRDYLLFLDATIARFRAISDLGRAFLGEVAQHEGLCSSGEFLDEKELSQMGVTGNWWEIADLIWLASNGAILDPNYVDGDASGMCGMHGYSPQFSDMDSLFLCWGPGIPRLTIPRAQLTSVCRTICDLVGIHAPDAAAPSLY